MRWRILVSAGIGVVSGVFCWFLMVPHSFNEVGGWTVVFLYLPMLVVVLVRKSTSDWAHNTRLPASTSAKTSTGIAKDV